MDSLNDNLSFFVEFPYTDSHFRDCYYFYHAAKFVDLPRETLRVHIFDSSIVDVDSLFDNVSNEVVALSELYYGFFIVRPLNRFPLGHSFISPRAFKQRNFLCCLVKERVYLLGIRLEVCAFPHVPQDTETHTCAESSLWALLNYYGSKYKNYQTLLPSDIIRLLDSVSAHRMLPSNGLTVNELSTVLTRGGHNCVLYTENTDKEMLLQIMRIYRNRNLIIHNGRSMPYLPLLIENLHSYVDTFLDYMIDGFSNGNGKEQIYQELFLKECNWLAKIKVKKKQIDEETVEYLLS